MSEQASQGMTQTRRAFIGQGAFAFLAAAGLGHRSFGATGPARLKFGALSDIHITRGKGSCDIFEKALTYFRDQKVDAVLIAGDMAADKPFLHRGFFMEGCHQPFGRQLHRSIAVKILHWLKRYGNWSVKGDGVKVHREEGSDD